MKRIILTESQYKRLVKQKLNEYIVYSDPKDEYDATPNIRLYLGTLGQNLKIKYDINTYVSKIEDGIVYLVADKYNEEQKKTISDIIDYWVKYTPEDDEKIGNIDYFSGLDWDYGDEEIEDDESTAEVEDDESTAEIEDDESTAEVEGDDVVVDYEPNKTYSRTEYINLVKDIAIDQMKKHKIPASITIAQAVLESGNGNSKLARNGKNHFGIKCHGWTGDKSYHDDDRPDECFRNYDEIEDSFEDHSNFLKNNSRYNKLFDLDITDYKGWAKGLKKAGYATKSTYDKTLIDIIEKNNLQKYD
jgi:flagellum-specific peptidoglycan hydrolase FlgJ